jgi:hypothetical protein
MCVRADVAVSEEYKLQDCTMGLAEGPLPPGKKRGLRSKCTIASGPTVHTRTSYSYALLQSCFTGR